MFSIRDSPFELRLRTACHGFRAAFYAASTDLTFRENSRLHAFLRTLFRQFACLFTFRRCLERQIKNVARIVTGIAILFWRAFQTVRRPATAAGASRPESLVTFFKFFSSDKHFAVLTCLSLLSLLCAVRQNLCLKLRRLPSSAKQ